MKNPFIFFEWLFSLLFSKELFFYLVEALFSFKFDILKSLSVNFFKFVRGAESSTLYRGDLISKKGFLEGEAEKHCRKRFN